ncbi:MAG: CAP domain-containing protein [Myxococcota bacterium]|nr:CAP domain-containing protein [Myxococcota bacterium]MEC8424715.1 CAP domain-containing protein [Myxococcota bacterium]
MLASLLPLALSASASAGYGDVDATGYPSWAERSVHLWTNAARVDPEAFDDEYRQAYEPCSFADFTADEQTPKPPIYYDRALNDAARFHSQDMVDNDWFAHESSDGTSFGDRMARYYDSGYIGENIAYGYPSPFSAMFHGWMCSEGHRANIMTAGWTELGTGVVGTHYTQDFGGGTPDSDGAVAMGVHEPASANDTATFYADWLDSDAPTYLRVVIDGRPSALGLEYGVDTQGVFAAEVEVEPGDCHAYYFAWETADGATGTFPETGSYTYGANCTDGIGWTDEQAGDAAGGASGAGSLDTDDIRLIGCTSAPGRPGPIGALALLGVMVLGRRRV